MSIMASSTRVSMEVSHYYIVNWVTIYLGAPQPTYIGVVILLLSIMDIPVWKTTISLNERKQILGDTLIFH